MKCVGNKFVWPSALSLVMYLFVSTGCTKEELLEPKVIENTAGVSTKSAPGTVAPPPPGTTSGTSSPISDDGDDLGDGERPKRPKN
ncbi:MAG: hypothetical protein KBH07_00025 [Flavobacteriales bacterium]|nr:hypothetical protein [Flavobacteriales bacterium]MBP9079107.1 hypothetical protein [Flavobacteriales bacterium]